jgi:hypothetical protein
MQKGWNKWTKEMDSFLMENYEWIGDYGLAEMFEEKFPKGYPWTNKHIEKRRSYLGLKRTKEQAMTLKYIGCLLGDHVKLWDTRGRAKEKEIREWKGRKYIKVGGRFTYHSTYDYEQRTGQKLPPGYVIRDGKLISRFDHAIINTTQRHGKRYPAALLETKILTFKLKRLTDGKEN